MQKNTFEYINFNMFRNKFTNMNYVDFLDKKLLFPPSPPLPPAPQPPSPRRAMFHDCVTPQL